MAAKSKVTLKSIKSRGGAGEWALDTTKFNKMLGELAKKFTPPLTLKEALEAEVLSILQSAARKTKRVNINKLKARYNPNHAKYIRMVRVDGKLYSTTRRYSDSSLQNRVNKQIAFYKERAFDRIGLSKAIFYALAKDSLNLPGYDRNWGADSKYIKKAYMVQKRAGKGRGASGNKGKNAPSRFTRSSTTNWLRTQKGWKEERGTDEFIIKISLSGTLNTLNPFAKGVAATQSAINGRLALFRKSIKKGFFDDIKRNTRNYPNVRVS